MKPQVIAGLVIAAAGLFLVFRGGSFGSQRSVVRVGDVQASVEERRTVPPWVGIVAIGGGLLLAVTGMRGRRA